MDYRIKHLLQMFNKTKRNMFEGEILGIEIKARRLASSQTLTSLCSGLCSTSYLSKIENCRIKPNRKFVKELCGRIGLDENQANILFDLKGIIMKAIECFLIGDIDYIKNVYLESKGLQNYRFRILEYIYFIAVEDYNKANMAMNELLKISRGMYDFDLLVFTTFSGILFYYNQSYSEAKEMLESIKIYLDDHNLYFLVKKYYFLSLICLDEVGCINIYHSLNRKLISHGLYKEADYIKYAMCIYLYRNDEFAMYKDVYKSINNNKYRRSLIYQLRDKFKCALDVPSKWLADFDLSTLIIYYLHNDKVEALKLHRKYRNQRPGFDYNYMYLTYRNLEDDNEKYGYICDKILPKLELTREGYFIRYFLDSLAKLSDKNGKYKLFIDCYKRFI